jgi:hypothetical protein
VEECLPKENALAYRKIFSKKKFFFFGQFKKKLCAFHHNVKGLFVTSWVE